MYARIKQDLEQAFEKIRWFATILSERVRIEISVFKLLHKADEMKKRRGELLKTLGEVTYELRGKNRNPYARSEVIEAIRELEKLDPEIRETVDKAMEISKIVT